MRIVFFGSGEIAVASLEALLESGHEVVGVVTSPDKKKGRHLAIASTSVKDYALKGKLKILQPEKLSDKANIDLIAKLNPDAFVVFSYGKILPKKLLEVPKLMPINIHASLLPKYRGAAPINWALINGETETGITIIKMDEKMDEGEIVLKEAVEIAHSDTYVTLESKLSELGAGLIKQALKDLESGSVQLSAQNAEQATYAPKLRKEDGKIDWSKTAAEIRNLVRGCLPWPGAYTHYQEKLLKIWQVEVSEQDLVKRFKPGEVISWDKSGILVATKKKALLVKELQLASGKKLNAWQFVQGHSVEKGKLFK